MTAGGLAQPPLLLLLLLLAADGSQASLSLGNRSLGSKDCEDEPGFVDPRGYTCAEWNNHDCIRDAGIERYDLAEVLMLVRGCRKTCKFCGASQCLSPWVQDEADGGSCAEGKIIGSFETCTTQCSEGFIPSVPILQCIDGSMFPVHFECYVDVRRNRTELCGKEFQPKEEMVLDDSSLADGCHLKGPTSGEAAVIRSLHMSMGLHTPMILGEGNLLVTGRFVFENVRLSAGKNLTFRDAEVVFKMPEQDPLASAVVRSAAVLSCVISSFDTIKKTPGHRQALHHAICGVRLSESSVTVHGSKSWQGVNTDLLKVSDHSDLRLHEVGYMPANFGVEGGGVNCHFMAVENHSQVVVWRAQSTGSGGGVFSLEELNVTNRAALHVFRTDSWQSGGGVYSHHMLIDDNSELLVENGFSSRGGCIAVFEGLQVLRGSKVSLRACEAAAKGGALYANNGALVDDASELRIVNATAQQGSAIYSNSGLLDLRQVSFINLRVSEAGFAAPAIFSSDRVNIGRAKVQHVEMALVYAHKYVHVGELASKKSPATLLNMYGEVKVGLLRCGSGYEAHKQCVSWPRSFCCKKCQGGWVQWQKLVHVRNNSIWNICRKCPPEVWSCTAKTIIFPAGFKDGTKGGSAHRCPNSVACPGGSLPKDWAGRPMCAKPYKGPGCAVCHDGYGRAEANPFVCVPCGKTAGAVVMRWLVFMTLPGIVFAISLRRVYKARRRRSESSVLLNQIMSFSTLASIVLNGLRETPAYRKAKTVLLPDSLGHAVESSSYYAESVSGSSLLSVDCLLADLRMEKNMSGHNLVVTLQFVLMVLLGAAGCGFTASFLTGINCFAPVLSASYSRYLPCFHVVSNGRDRRIYNPMEVCRSGMLEALSVVGIAICLLGGPGLWFVWTISDSTKNKLPLQRNTYREGYEFGESLVILRKALLRLAATASPMTYSPGSQLFYVMLVTMASYMWQSQAQPYAREQWNAREHRLLSVSLFTIACVAYLGDPDWGHSEIGSWIIITLVTFATAATEMTLFYLLARRLMDQCRGRTGDIGDRDRLGTSASSLDPMEVELGISVSRSPTSLADDPDPDKGE